MTWTTNLRLRPQGTGHNITSGMGALAPGDSGSQVDERSRSNLSLLWGELNVILDQKSGPASNFVHPHA